MPQKAKPGEKTLLELITQGEIRTSEDLPTLSESEFVQKWGLPLITGVEMETEDYDPGALDAAFAAIPFVGGSIKTGAKLAKEVAKKVGSAYKKSIRPRVFPKKDALLRFNERHDEFMRQSYEETQNIAEFTQEFRRNNPGLRSEAYPLEEMIGTRAPTEFASIEAAPTAQAISRRTRSTIPSINQTADDVAEQITLEFGMSSNVSWNEAQSIVADIGPEGWARYRSELRSLPIEQRELHLENFLSKYRSTGRLTGQEASTAYKVRKFSSKMPDEIMTIDKGRHGELEYISTTVRKNTSQIKLKWSSPSNKNISADLQFKIQRKTDEAGNAFDEISAIGFYASQSSKRYAGRLMGELLKKIPENTVINESSLTYDSLYLLLRQSIKNNAKIIFHKTNPKFPSSARRKQSSGASRLSPWSIKFNESRELYKETGDPRYIDKAVDEIMDEFRGMINEYAEKSPENVVGRPDLKAIKKPGESYLSFHPTPEDYTTKGQFEYNMISIHKMTAALAGIFGYSNKEEFIKFLSYNPESTEAQIFDNEFSI
tara:strand:+ start:60 stop:1691 length:1632 start_codon:yes stop_codon:yes gene_type:complete